MLLLAYKYSKDGNYHSRKKRKHTKIWFINTLMIYFSFHTSLCRMVYDSSHAMDPNVHNT